METLLVRAVRILGELAMFPATTFLTQQQRREMQEELFEVLEALNDMQVKVPDGTR